MRGPLAAAIAATFAIGLVVAEGPPPQIVYTEDGGVPLLSNGRISARWTQDLLPVVELKDGGLPFTIMLSEIVEFEDHNANGFYESSEAVLVASTTSGAPWAKRSSGFLSSHAFTVAVAGESEAQTIPPGPRASLTSVGLGVTLADESVQVLGAPLEVNEAMFTFVVDSWPWVSNSNVLAVRMLVAGAQLRVGDRVVRPETPSFPVSAYDNRAEIEGRDGALGYVRWPSSGSVGTVLGPSRSLAVASAGGVEATDSRPAGVELTFLFSSSYGARSLEFSPVVGVATSSAGGAGDEPVPPILAGIAVVAALAVVMLRRRAAPVRKPAGERQPGP